MVRHTVLDRDLASRCGARKQVGAGLKTVGNYGMGRCVQLGDPGDFETGCAGAGYGRPHRTQEYR